MTEEVPTRRNVIEDFQNGVFSSVRLGSVGRASRRHARQAFFVPVGQPPSHENAGASWREHIFDVGTLRRHRRHSNSVPCTVRRKLFSGKRSISPSIGYYRLPSTILRRIVRIDTSIYTWSIPLYNIPYPCDRFHCWAFRLSSRRKLRMRDGRLLRERSNFLPVSRIWNSIKS